MTTPNEYTRTSLASISATTTRTLRELEEVIPHIRAVANTLTGYEGRAARMALERAELTYNALTQADAEAEAAKTLFRSATYKPQPCTPAPAPIIAAGHT